MNNPIRVAYENMANSNLENYTNKIFLVREHQAWIDRLQMQNMITLAWNTGCRGCDAQNSSCQQCKVGEINAKNRVNISTLTLSINQTLHGKLFLCRSITPPYKTVSLETVVEDPEGVNAVRLALYNFTMCTMGHDLTKVIPVGALLVIKNPFFKVAAGDGGYMLRVDNPKSVLFIEEQVCQTIFPDLSWKGSIPKQYQKYISKTFATEESKTEKSKAAPPKSNKKINNGGFQPGDIIQGQLDSFAKVLSDESKGKRCDNCFEKSSKLLRCSNCLLMYYCNKRCQVKDWKDGHSFECKSEFFKALSNVYVSSEFNRQIFRLFAMLKLKPEHGEKKYQLYDGTERSFFDLLAHQSELKTDIRLTKVCEYMSKELGQEQLHVNNDDGVNHLLRLAAAWSTNALPIRDKNAIIGSAIFIESSAFDHSCKPNAYFNWQECKLQIRAISSIPTGTKPCVSYLESNEFKKRQVILMEKIQNSLQS